MAHLVSFAHVFQKRLGRIAPKSVVIDEDGTKLPVSRMVSDSQTNIEVDITLAPDSKLGAYDIIVELANGSRIVKSSGYSLEKAT